MSQLALQQALSDETLKEIEALSLRIADLGQLAPKGRNRKERQAEALRERDRLRARIDTLVLPPPFKAADNGVHEYLETSKFVVFRNHGDAYWQAAIRNGGGWRPFGEEIHDPQRGKVHLIYRDLDGGEMLRKVEAAVQ